MRNIKRLGNLGLVWSLLDQLVWSFGFYLTTLIIVWHDDLSLLNQFTVASTVAFIAITFARALGGEQSIYVEVQSESKLNLHKFAFQGIAYGVILFVTLLATLAVLSLEHMTEIEIFFILFFSLYVINDLIRVQSVMSRKALHSIAVSVFLVLVNIVTLYCFLRNLSYMILMFINLMCVTVYMLPTLRWLKKNYKTKQILCEFFSIRSLVLFQQSFFSVFKNTGIFLLLPILGHSILLTSYRTIYTLIFSPLTALIQGINLYLLKKYYSLSGNPNRRDIVARITRNYLLFIILSFLAVTLVASVIFHYSQLGNSAYFSKISLYGTSLWILGSLMMSGTSLGLRVSYDVRFLNRSLSAIQLLFSVIPLLGLLFAGTNVFWMSLMFVGLVSIGFSSVLYTILRKSNGDGMQVSEKPIEGYSPEWRFKDNSKE